MGPVERPLTEQQTAADLATARSMWELAAAFQFLGQFQHWLGLSQAYSLAQVEEELVRSPGPGEWRDRPGCICVAMQGLS